MVRPCGFANAVAPLKEKEMYKVTKAIIVKDGRQVREYNIDDETDDLELTRANILGRFGTDCMNEVSEELQYKIIGAPHGETGKGQN